MPKNTRRKLSPAHRSGTAGRDDPAARSDIYVSLVEDDSGGVVLNLESKVDALYGDSIKRSVQKGLAAFGFISGVVNISDRGALPFVIRARLETALRRAGFKGDALAGRAVSIFSRSRGTKKDRIRRSRLYLPGNEPKYMVNAGLHKPDGVILDLEDSVHADEKDAARLVVRNALLEVDFMGAERMVRINQLPLGLQDLDVVIPSLPDLILIPKVESSAQVKLVDKRIQKTLTGLGSEKKIWLMPILESALGIEQAFEIARASEHVAALTIGLEDYTADLGAQKTKEGTESLFARFRLVNAARAAGLQAIDSVFGDVADASGLAQWAERSRGMGFEGMGCVHPRQIAPIHSAFSPSQEEIERALAVVAAFDEAKAKGLSVVSVGSRMVDPPVVLRAQQLVGYAIKTGMIDDS